MLEYQAHHQWPGFWLKVADLKPFYHAFSFTVAGHWLDVSGAGGPLGGRAAGSIPLAQRAGGRRSTHLQLLRHLSLPVNLGILLFSFYERTKCCFTQFAALSVPVTKLQSVGKDRLDDL